mmetsp:Transcript_62115/g.113683  ORF Transcript_62115/g.113683 Transcript_62115/m.113683 type:complete len:223 (+) Transcript_62115:34-702(+)
MRSAVCPEGPLRTGAGGDQLGPVRSSAGAPSNKWRSNGSLPAFLFTTSTASHTSEKLTVSSRAPVFVAIFACRRCSSCKCTALCATLCHSSCLSLSFARIFSSSLAISDSRCSVFRTSLPRMSPSTGPTLCGFVTTWSGRSVGPHLSFESSSKRPKSTKASAPTGDMRSHLPSSFTPYAPGSTACNTRLQSKKVSLSSAIFCRGPNFASLTLFETRALAAAI